MTLWQDIRYGERLLRKSPGFAVTAVLTLALGIGATTAIFSVVDALLWKPIALPHLETLAVVVQAIPGEPGHWNDLPPADLDDVRRESKSIESLATWQFGMANIVGAGGEPERAMQSLVSANFFTTLGVQPVLGRGFQEGEDQPGREREVVLSDRLWRRRFAADPAIVGKNIRLDDQNFLVTGIMPASFDFPMAAELWTPHAFTPEQRANRRNESLTAAARLKPGRTIEQANAEVDRISARLEQTYPATNKGRRMKSITIRSFLVETETQQYVKMLLYSVIFVLLIACVNVANLQFARATSRLREVAVRTALGAARWRVVSQLVTESVLLSIAGAALGLLIAWWGIGMMRAGMPAEIERYILGWKEIHLDMRTLLFTLVAAVLSGILAGLAPAWQCSRPNLTDALKEGGRGGTSGSARHRLRNILVAGEVALAVVLLAGAGLMVRGFRALVANGARLDPDTLLTLRISLTDSKYPENFQRTAFFRDLLDRVNAIPGVQSSAVVTALPYSNHSNGRAFTIEGRPAEPDQLPVGMYQVATPGYFNLAHIPLIEGRLLRDTDGADAPKVALVSQRMAERWWKKESPLGQHIRIGRPRLQGAVDHHCRRGRRYRATTPMNASRGVRSMCRCRRRRALWMDVGIRTAGDPLAVAPAVTAAVRAVDREQPVTDMMTMAKAIHNRAIGLNYMAVLMGVFGLLALLLSAIGVYGVMAYMVSEQTHEIGIRMALGAERQNVLGMVFRRGIFTVAAGLVVGLPLAFAFARLMASLIFGVTANDPVTFVGIPLALITAAAVAIYIPARRATKIDPIVALRYE